ncbi:hypothetical protein BB560_005691 [Smittium megazygosporum]|nr:hypothetical protein BB560_006774 [Smittium megazygosporum]PVU98302.1 hypothetical protein BB560_005691 [Smittium megazygosporum]
MSSSSENCFIAYPAPSIDTSNSSSNNGSFQVPVLSDVMIFDGNTCEAMSIIQAHKGSISCLAINSDGTLLATSSEKGTLVRVFSIPSFKKIAQFRRGTYSAAIHSITFNAKSTMIIVSSDSDTIHIFRIQDGTLKDLNNQSQNEGLLENSSNSADDLSYRVASEASSNPFSSESRPYKYSDRYQLNPEMDPEFEVSPGNTAYNGFGSSNASSSNKPEKTKKSSWKGLVSSKLIGKAASYIPGQLSQIWEPARDFAHLKLPKSGLNSIAAMLR